MQRQDTTRDKEDCTDYEQPDETKRKGTEENVQINENTSLSLSQKVVLQNRSQTLKQ